MAIIAGKMYKNGAIFKNICSFSSIGYSWFDVVEKERLLSMGGRYSFRVVGKNVKYKVVLVSVTQCLSRHVEKTIRILRKWSCEGDEDTDYGGDSNDNDDGDDLLIAF